MLYLNYGMRSFFFFFKSSCKYFYNEYLGFVRELFDNSTTVFCPGCLFLLIIAHEEHTDCVDYGLYGYLRVCLEFEFLEAELEVVRFLESHVRKGDLKVNLGVGQS